VNTRSGCSLACSAIHCRFVDTFMGLSVPSCVSHQWFWFRDIPLPSFGSRRTSVPRSRRYYEDATTSRSAWPSAHCFAFRLHRPLHLRVRRGAPRDRQGCREAGSVLFSRRSEVSGAVPVGASGISQVPRQPLLRLCDGPGPRTAPTGLAMADGRMLPPGRTHRRRHHDHDIGATAPLHRPLSPLHDRRHRRPCKTRFRRAGCAFAGRASNPLGRCERFQSVPHLLSNFIRAMAESG